MKSPIRSLAWLSILSLTLLSCTTQTKNPSPIAKHVIVIGIDGMSPDGITHADTPHMNNMMANGSYSMHARSVMPSSSGANWGSMIMGAGPEQHGIVSNDWTTKRFELHPTVIRNKNLFPTVFAVIRDQRPDAEIGAILDWNPISNFIEEDVTNYMELPENEDETTKYAVDYITEKTPDFTFIHIDHVDAAGHGQGHGSPEYYAAVAKADSLIGEIIKATEEAGIAEETIIIISSDHGGVGFGHGGNSPAEMEIPFMVYGKGVEKGHVLNFPINTYDNPATALFALGLEIPYEWIGRPAKGAFTGYDDPELMYKLNQLVSAPIILPKGEGGSNPPGGLFVGETAELRIRNSQSRGEIRYTLDGSVPKKASPLYQDPIPITENIIVTAAIFEGDNIISEIAYGYFRVVPEEADYGLSFSLYELPEDAVTLPDFSALTPVRNGEVREISTNNLPLTRESYVGAVLKGSINIPEDGEYLFSLSSDDGSKLYINDELVVNNDGDHGVITKNGSKDLEEGRHKLRVEWFNGGGGYWLGAYIEGPGLARQIIPPSMLTHP